MTTKKGRIEVFHNRSEDPIFIHEWQLSVYNSLGWYEKSETSDANKNVNKKTTNDSLGKVKNNGNN